MSDDAAVLRIGDGAGEAVSVLLQPAGLAVTRVPLGDAIPGSHWGDDEAGLIGSRLYVRDDTPVHSALHEAGHWLLMDPARRATLHTDAGGSSDEENAVCLLQILLADEVPPMTRARMFEDMDAWGYSFRLGSARAWFDHDAQDARRTLHDRLCGLSLATSVMQRLHDALA